MRVAVIGAGIGGSFLAYLLAQKQIPTVVFEGKRAREKPCGGGCTPKVARTYPLFASAFLRRNQIRQIHYASSRKQDVLLKLRDPIWVYSRRDLDGFLLEEALRNGGRLVQQRAVDYQKAPEGGWIIRTEDGGLEKADILVGADGANSALRKRFDISFGPKDLSVTLGYYLPGSFHPDSIYIRFLDPLVLGYMWCFPRVDHVSVGIISRYRDLPASQLKTTLNRYVLDRYGEIDWDSAKPYAAPVPTLSPQTFDTLRVNGPDWALIGDAAGFVDPITAEGIYYALRSAELLAESIVRSDLESYHRSWREDFGRDLAMAARLKRRFYYQRFFFDTFINRMLQFTLRSKTVQQAHNDLISGRQGYLSLTKRLTLSFPRIVIETLLGHS